MQSESVSAPASGVAHQGNCEAGSTVTRARRTVVDVHQWASGRRYLGYEKHDALSSPLLWAVFGFGKWTRIAAVQGVMRFPINLRPLLLVPRQVNPKGLSLFARGLLDLYAVSSDPRYVLEAERLADWLLDLRDRSRSGAGWGYHYPWQDLGFFAPSRTPNAVVTAFVCRSLLAVHKHVPKSAYLEAVDGAIDFFLGDLPRLVDSADELCLGYMPLPMTMRVMDVSILVGVVLAEYRQMTGDARHQSAAARLVRYVARRQTEEGAWFYTDPPGDSPLRHDNYHTGFILDALDDYMRASGDDGYSGELRAGLRFYADRLFNGDGSPRWMSDQDYPHDIHGAAQGIITFSRHRTDYPELADRIARWTLDNMYSGRGYFYYQKHRRRTSRFTLMRWCNAWMFNALATYIRAACGAGA